MRNITYNNIYTTVQSSNLDILLSDGPLPGTTISTVDRNIVWVRQPAYCVEGSAGAPEAGFSWHTCNCSSLEILVPDLLPEMSDCTNSLCVYNSCFATRHGSVFPYDMKTTHERNQCASAFNTVPEYIPTVPCLRSQ